MAILHIINATAWLANTLVWAFYAHVPLMAVASLGAAIASVILARNEA